MSDPKKMRVSELVSLVALFTMRADSSKGEQWVANCEQRDAYMGELDARFAALPAPVKSVFDAATIPLPDFLPRAAWIEWCADRKQRRKPITERGAKNQIKELARLMMLEGHQPADVIAHSIAGGYQGLFPPKASTSSEPGWRSEQRERTQLAAPGVAARSPAQEFFEAEARNVTPHRLG